MAVEKETVSLREHLEMQINHQIEVANLRWKLSEVAINKAESAMTQRMEDSNNKYALLKEQAASMPTNADFKALSDKVDLLSKLVYVGMGIFLVIEFIARFIIKN